MSELVELALTLFIISQALGILLGLLGAVLMVFYAVIRTTLDIYRH